MNAITKQVAQLGIKIVVTMFIAAGFFTFIDNIGQGDQFSSGPLSFLDSFYFVIVTAASIGYGDIYPITWISRLAVILVVIMILYVFSE